MNEQNQSTYDIKYNNAEQFPHFKSNADYFEEWEELETVMSKQTVNRIENVYEHVDDIDLFIGGISETAVAGSLLGPTFRCLVGDQFKRLHHGDR